MLRFVSTMCVLAIIFQGLASFKIRLAGSAHLHTVQIQTTNSNAHIFDVSGRGLALHSQVFVQKQVEKKHQHNSIGHHTHLADIPALLTDWLNQDAHQSAAYSNGDQDVSHLPLLALLPTQAQRFSLLNTITHCAIASDLFESIDQKRIERPPRCGLTA